MKFFCETFRERDCWERKSKCRLKNSAKINLKKMAYVDVDWIYLVQDWLL
jgi:hypothetical protein